MTSSGGMESVDIVLGASLGCGEGPLEALQDSPPMPQVPLGSAGSSQVVGTGVHPGPRLAGPSGESWLLTLPCLWISTGSKARAVIPFLTSS